MRDYLKFRDIPPGDTANLQVSETGIRQALAGQIISNPNDRTAVAAIPGL